MKPIKLTLLLCLLIAVYSCNNKKSKKEDPVNAETKDQISDKFSGNKEDSVNAEANNKTTEQPIRKVPEQNVQEDLLPIELVVKEILTTSPRYLKLTKGLQERLVKNGGQYFGLYLERSPERRKGKKGSYSKTYDFTIYEMYEERKLNTSRFSFNPENRRLFEYNIANDSLMPIEYDRSLLLKYDSLNNK